MNTAVIFLDIEYLSEEKIILEEKMKIFPLFEVPRSKHQNEVNGFKNVKIEMKIIFGLLKICCIQNL